MHSNDLLAYLCGLALLLPRVFLVNPWPSTYFHGWVLILMDPSRFSFFLSFMHSPCAFSSIPGVLAISSIFLVVEKMFVSSCICSCNLISNHIDFQYHCHSVSIIWNDYNQHCLQERHFIQCHNWQHFVLHMPILLENVPSSFWKEREISVR